MNLTPQAQLWDDENQKEDGVEDVSSVIGSVKKVRLRQTASIQSAIVPGNLATATSVWVKTHLGEEKDVEVLEIEKSARSRKEERAEVGDALTFNGRR